MRVAVAAIVGCCAVHLGLVALLAGAATAPVFGIAAAAAAPVAVGVLAVTAAVRRRRTSEGDARRHAAR